MGEILSQAGADGALWGTLAFILISTVVIAFLFNREHFKNVFTTDAYHAARNTQGLVALSLSFFASGAGAWVIFTVPEAAILGGPIALAGYTISTLVPVIIFASVGPYMRRNLPKAFTFFDYVQERYGTLVNIYATLISFFYMTLYLSAEFKSLGDTYCWLAEGSAETPKDCLYGPVIGTSMVTLVYTAIGGLPVSLITDKVQGVGIFAFTILILIAAFTEYPLPGSNTAVSFDNATIVEQNWELVTSTGTQGLSNPDDYSQSVKMAITLICAVTCANLMHTGFQQRIWAAKNNKQLLLGAAGGVLLTIPFMCMFGVIGFIAFSNYGNILFAPSYIAFLASFFVISDTAVGWQVIALILAVLMVASSADTIQTGAAALMQPITKLGLGKMGIVSQPDDPKQQKLTNFVNFVLAAVVINLPAIVLATDQGNISTKEVSVLSLFVLADLACATCIVPLLMGLSHRVHPAAAMVGCATGFTLAMIIYGVGVSGEEGKYDMLLEAGGLYSDTALTAFIVVPFGSGIMTLLSNIPFYLKGYRFAGFADKPGTKVVKGADTTRTDTTAGEEVVKSAADTTRA
jgi:Na+/proline symporter